MCAHTQINADLLDMSIVLDEYLGTHIPGLSECDCELLFVFIIR